MLESLERAEEVYTELEHRASKVKEPDYEEDGEDLYAFLEESTEGSCLEVVETHKDAGGFEAWRQL